MIDIQDAALRLVGPGGQVGTEVVPAGKCAVHLTWAGGEFVFAGTPWELRQAVFEAFAQTPLDPDLDLELGREHIILPPTVEGLGEPS